MYLLSDETISGAPRPLSQIVATWFTDPSDELEPDLVTRSPVSLIPQNATLRISGSQNGALQPPVPQNVTKQHHVSQNVALRPPV